MSVSAELNGSERVNSTDRKSRGRKRWPRRQRPLLPTADPFYIAPREFAALKPGTIIRTREVEVAAFGRIPQKIQAWQLLYRSADLEGRPEASVTTVLLPRGADPTVSRPLLAFQCAIDAVAARCFPSYALQRGAKTLGSVVPFEFLLIGGALREGWAVIVTDHEGIGGGFGVPREPGYRVLDGVRAALSFEPLNLGPETPVAAWGYSGGGMATSWVVEMAPTYAPEINLVGGVLGAPVGDPGSAFWNLNGTLHAGLATVVIAALRHRYPALATTLNLHATFEGRRRLDLVERLTTVSAVLKFAGDDFDDFVDEPLAELLATPGLIDLFDELRLGGNRPECPLLVVQPVHDQIIATADIDGQVQRYVDLGADVTYVRDRLSEHLSGIAISAPLALKWIQARFDEESTAPGTQTVWTIADVRGLASMVLTAARMLTGLPITPILANRRKHFGRRRQLPYRRAS